MRARAELRERLGAGSHVDLAGEHDEAQLAGAGVERLTLARLQAQCSKAHMRPARAFGRDVDDLAAGAPRLGQQRARHDSASTMRFRVS
jgi:hypothetical protein